MIKKLELYEETPSGYKHPENIIQDKINELVDWINQVDGKVIKCESVQNMDTEQKLEKCIKLLQEFTNLDYTDQTPEFNEIIWKVDSFLQEIGRTIM